jgi:hypothetical protein
MTDAGGGLPQRPSPQARLGMSASKTPTSSQPPPADGASRAPSITGRIGPFFVRYGTIAAFLVVVALFSFARPDTFASRSSISAVS